MLFPSDHLKGLTTRPEILESAGRPVSYVDIKIVDESGDQVRQGEVGELLVNSETASPGYWGMPPSSADGEWLRTGDLARQDEEGYVYLFDRVRFRIKSGGYNVFPTEVENVLATHPAVDEVSVFGIPDSVWGDRIEAVVTLKKSATVTPAELREFCRGKIADFKVPKHVEIWADLPKGTTGKILKREIIEIRKGQQDARASVEAERSL
jgi:acyl-CoA synthetase (AMP-forming)/AMP-acid ligase II